MQNPVWQLARAQPCARAGLGGWRVRSAGDLNGAPIRPRLITRACAPTGS